ncbi:hypothetical protein HCN44_002543 [Aphidius gifuensis]|uniref:GBD/FH3 domain-containing protein n=1 Tax=Aphidius gifuensis TaxID=684658 RepID=A0A834Y3A6_APHGI|nr:hypothetical protein HCN44_002543 [Aphidius gifuensis]
MSPNAEDEMLVMKSWEIQHEKERLRPPTYNAEDYAMALRRWGRRPISNIPDFHGTLPSTTSSSSGYVSGSGEMTLRQFTSVSELLNKLRADLRLAFPSFVQEFASSPADGINLLLETLRGVQLIQNTPPSGQNGARIGTRRAALDELGCVECLSACAERCADVPRLLSQAQPGLLALAVCLTSSLNRSRVLALQLLTKVCQTIDGHAAVTEAVSSLRLRYGEGGRFRFLAGSLLAPRAALALRVAGVSFLNAFLTSAPRTQTKLYIQAEACEAGLEPKILEDWLVDIDNDNEQDTLTELLKIEIKKWSNNCVDVDELEKRLEKAEETCLILGNKVTILQNKIKKLKFDKSNNNSHENIEILPTNNIKLKRLSSNIDDEGISSSERSSSPDNICNKNKKIENKIKDNDQETTIDDVIEELRIIVKDAEEEDRVGLINDNDKKKYNSISNNNIIVTRDDDMDYYACVNKNKDNKNNNASTEIIDNDSLKIIVKSANNIEDEIIPAILYPQPPRRALPCLSTILATRNDEFINNSSPVVFNSHDDDDDVDDAEEETLDDGSDSLLSASKLKYNTNKNDCINIEEEKFYYAKNHEETYKKFNKISKSYHDNSSKNSSNNIVTNGAKKIQVKGKLNDYDKKKSVERSMSHDYISNNNLIYDFNNDNHKIFSRIKKFESLNSFDNTNFNINSNEKHDKSATRQSNEIKKKIRRSESCHQVFNETKNDNLSNKGGSDSGLQYITDYNLQTIKLMKQ